MPTAEETKTALTAVRKKGCHLSHPFFTAINIAYSNYYTLLPKYLYTRILAESVP